MCIILTEEDINEHINLSISEIDNKIDSFMKSGSGWNLVRIEILTIEAYIYQRAFGRSYISTPKKLANTKCTINPNNSKIINPVTGALACYYAHKDGYTEHLERIFTKKDYKQYLDIVNLDGIPIPTPICSRIFNKIEEMNPDISINIWEWKEETATSKPVIASKNYNRQHIIYLIALTDIIKSEDYKNKYGQKNHFLWIKNPDGLVYKDNTNKVKKYLCNRCFHSFQLEKSLAYHQKHCFGLGEATQRVELPTKANFEADNKKCDEKYGGQMRKLAEQKANSFCYLVHWIDTGNELVEINRVLAIKHNRIETDKDKKKFNEADSCWICKDKFDTDNKDKIWDHCHIT
ncbi:22830_t:CDS:2, partial [Cetraspora pellucida]